MRTWYFGDKQLDVKYRKSIHILVEEDERFLFDSQRQYFNLTKILASSGNPQSKVPDVFSGS